MTKEFTKFVWLIDLFSSVFTTVHDNKIMQKTTKRKNKNKMIMQDKDTKTKEGENMKHCVNQNTVVN